MITPDEFYERRADVMEKRKEHIEQRLLGSLRGKANDFEINEPFLIPVYDKYYDWNDPYPNEEVEHIKQLLVSSGWHVHPGVRDLKDGRVYLRVQSKPIINDREIARRGFWSRLFNK